MTSRVLHLGSAHPRPGRVIGASVLFLGLIATCDYLTGPYVVVSTFYIVPVAVTAWFVGRRPAVVLGLLAAVCGFTATALHPEGLGATVFLYNEVLRFVTYTFVAVLVSAERAAMNEVRALASVDPLTQLLNRRRFYELAALELARAKRSGQPIAVVYVDLDDLKQRNDTAGHAAGDRLLAAFAESARLSFRSTDLIARLGGDEFCLLLPDADLDAASTAIARLRRRLEGDRGSPTRFSAGVVSGAVPQGLDVESAVRSADRLMLEAKGRGKNQSQTRSGFVADEVAFLEPGESGGVR